MLIQMCGDSKTVVEWLRGRWGTANNGYAKRVADIQDEMWGISEEYDIEGPSAGDDLWKHIHREANTYADELTWHARNGKCSMS